MEVFERIAGSKSPPIESWGAAALAVVILRDSTEAAAGAAGVGAVLACAPGRKWPVVGVPGWGDGDCDCVSELEPELTSDPGESGS